jgi:tRNA G10  N-methylase Trm11
MKKETLYRLIKEVIKESEEPTINPELKNLLDILQYDYNMFAEVAPYTIAEDTPLGQKHGVTKIKADDFDVRIYFESDEAMESFVRILEDAGLKRNKVSVQRQVGHFTAKKQRQSKNPKVYAKMGPRVIFHAPDDNGE